MPSIERLNCPSHEEVCAAIDVARKTNKYSEVEHFLRRTFEHHLAALEKPFDLDYARAAAVTRGESIDERHLAGCAELSRDLAKFLHYEPLTSAAKVLLSIYQVFGLDEEYENIDRQITLIERKYGRSHY